MSTVQEILQERESYKVPDKLMKVLFSHEKNAFLARLADGVNIDGKDALRDEYQQGHEDRDRLKQDYTPDCLTALVSRLIPAAECYADICAGTGALTLGTAQKYHDAFYRCEELAARAIPFLLCNLSLYNLSAEVRQADALTGETEKIYQLTPGKRFSEITATSQEEDRKFKCVVMNPPYSMKWKPIHMKQFEGYEPLPTNAADYVFVLHGLSLLESCGTLIAVLPHGVLFRGGREGTVRRKLLQENLIDAIIGLPNNMFMHTGIPVALLILKKDRKRQDVLFVDASKEFVKCGKQNVMEASHLEKIECVYKNRLEVQRFSHLAQMKEIEENEYNLNIPRYVDTYVPEPIEPLSGLLDDIADLQGKIRDAEKRFYGTLQDLIGTTPEEAAQLEIEKEIAGKILEASAHQESRRRNSDASEQSLF